MSALSIARQKPTPASWSLVEDRIANHLELRHVGKLDRATRNLLWGHGWDWDRSARCWTHARTESALASAFDLKSTTDAPAEVKPPGPTASDAAEVASWNTGGCVDGEFDPTSVEVNSIPAWEYFSALASGDDRYSDDAELAWLRHTPGHPATEEL